MLVEQKRRFICNIIGFCLMVFGLLYGFYCESIFFKLMEDNLVMRPDSEIFELWKSPPVKVTLDFYLFNWTNPQDFQDLSIKPQFEELGPYRFIEEPDKVDIKWHPENASMTYRKRSKYIFVEAESNGSLTDKIVTINSLAVSLSAKAKAWGALRRKVIDIGLRVYNADISIKKTVSELLFEGYEDMLLNVASVIPSSIIDVTVPFDRFGYCYPRNSSSEVTGVFNMYTGADDIRKLGQLHTWNYKQSTAHYASECAKVYGSPGEFQPPHLESNKPINLFLSDFCRAVTLDYVSTATVENIEGHRYEGGLRLIDNGTLYPENTCHCNGRCVPSGVVNITSCWFGAPIFLSYPHFHEADPYYLAQVEGLKPERAKHELYMVIEPKTGLMMELAGRLQSNILVEPISDFSMFRHNRTVFFPLFWFDARTRITPQLASDFKLLPRLIFGSQLFAGLCALSGLVLVAWQPLAAHLRQRLMQQIKINNLENEEHHIVGKYLGAPSEISPFLIRAVLERGDTTLSTETYLSNDTDAGENTSTSSSAS